MRKDKIRAFELRRRSNSFSFITNKLGIPKSTLSVWFKNEPWSTEIKNKLAAEVSLKNSKKLKKVSEVHRKRWEKWHLECQEEAIHEFPSLRDKPLFLAGLALYWSKGDKVLKNGIVRLSNSDPEMIKVFYGFLLSVIGIPKDKIKLKLVLYPDLVENVHKNLWAKLTGLPQNQFSKSIYLKSKSPKKRSSYGVCGVYVNSRKLKEKIMKWIELMQQYLNSV